MTMKVTTVAVPLVATALGDKCNLSTGCFAELGLIVRGEHFHFLDRVGIDGDVGTSVVPSVHVRSTVNRHFVLVRARAINIEGVQPARP